MTESGDMPSGDIRVFGLIGWSGSGKTTLITAVIDDLVGRGISVSTMKRAHHGFDVDHPGKDSYLHRAAGATEVMVTSAKRWALMHESRGDPEPSIEDAARLMTQVDLLLIEGFKHHAHDKLEVHRPSIGKTLLAPSDPHIVAVASDEELTGLEVPLLDLNNQIAVADFIVRHCKLEPRSESAA